MRLDDNSTELDLEAPEGFSKGLLPRSQHPLYAAYGSAPFAAPERVTPIPRVQWPDLWSDKRKAKATLRDVAEGAGIQVFDQNGTNYCHANSPAFALMLLRAKAGLPKIQLSAASIGGPVTGFRNAGAYIMDDLEQVVKDGACDVKFYPTNATGRGYWTEEAKANAALHKLFEFSDVPSRNLDIQMTLLLLDLPVCVGLNYWGHAVTDVGGEYLGGDVNRDSSWSIDFANSWKYTWGDNGYGKRTGRKIYADEAYAPRITLASQKIELV